jgi:hypothetical protein
MQIPSVLLRTGGALALCAATLSAQSLLPTGSSIGGGDDAVIGGVALPFSFTFPGGTVANSIDISTNGWIKPGGTGGSSELAESATLLQGGAPRICAYWDDLTETGQVFFDTSTPNVATITWFNTREFGNTGTFTVQAQLASNGTITIVWDVTTIQPQIDGDCLIGVSPGGGAADPGEVDFSDVNTMGAVVSAVDTVYELFPLTAGFQFDLQDGVAVTGLIFQPTNPGYIVTGMVPPPPPPPAEANPGRLACPPENFLPVPGTEVSFTLIPTAPGYLWTSGGAADPLAATGSLLTTTDDSITSTTTSFPFTFPDGTSTSAVDVDSNGRLLVGGTGELSDFSPSEAEFLNDAVGQIAPLWCDFNTTDTNTVDGIRFRDDGTGTSATYYWNGVVQFGNTTPNYFQVQLDASGGIQFNYLAVQINNDEATTPGLGSQSAVVGVSAGNGIVGAESDLSTGAVTSMTNVLYEFYDETLVEFDLVNNPLPPLPNETAEIVASTLPVLGTNFEVDVIDSTASAVAVVYYFGFPTGLFIPSIPLGSVIPALAGCELLNDIVTPGAVLGGNTGTPGTPTPVISIPNLPILLGVEGLVVSGIVVNPTLSPAIFPTDEIVTVLGV